MARLQILELPEGAGDARSPFVLVVDEMPTDEATFEALRRDLSDDVAQRIGARAVLAFETTVDIPANDTSAYLKDSASEGTLDDWDVRNAMAADMQTARDQVEAHEIRQRVDRECRAALADALGMDRTRDWDDIRNAAIGLRRERDSWAASAQRVRDLHRPVEHRGQTICWACSDYDFPGQTTDSPPVAYDQCSTLKALAGYPTPGQEQA